MCTLNCMCNVRYCAIRAQFLPLAVYWTYVHCTLGSLLKQCRGCALLTVGCCGEPVQCTLWSTLQVVASRGSVETSAFCREQCKLWSAGGLGRTVLSMPPWLPPPPPTAPPSTLSSQPVASSPSLFGEKNHHECKDHYSHHGHHEHSRDWLQPPQTAVVYFFEPKYFFAWKTRNLGLFWPVQYGRHIALLLPGYRSRHQNCQTFSVWKLFCSWKMKEKNIRWLQQIIVLVLHKNEKWDTKCI